MRVQWIMIQLSMQGTRVQSLVREESICCTETKPTHHNFWAQEPQILKPEHLDPVLHNKRSHHNENPLQRRVALLSTTRQSPDSNKDTAQPKMIKENILKRYCACKMLCTQYYIFVKFRLFHIPLTCYIVGLIQVVFLPKKKKVTVFLYKKSLGITICFSEGLP